MTNPAEGDGLSERLRAFLSFVHPRLAREGGDPDRLSQLRRMTDLRLRRFFVGRPEATPRELCALLAALPEERFDALAEEEKLLGAHHLSAPVPPLGEATGFLAEACLTMRALGKERLRSLAAEFVRENGPPPSGTPAAPPGEAAPAPLPEAVARLLGDVQDLWSVPAHISRIEQMLRRPETPVEDVAALLERDPGVSAQCLRVVNSAHYGMSQKVASVRRAVVMLGYQNTRRTVLLSALLARVSPPRDDVEIDLKSFWGHSLWTGHAAALVARESRLGEADEHFSAGLVHDIGKLVEVQYLPAQTRAVMAAVRRGSSWEEAEREALGVDHAAIGACVCERWSFPASLVDGVRHHLDSLAVLEKAPVSREAAVVAAMCTLSKRSVSAPELEGWCALLRLPPPRVAEIRTEATRLSLGALRDVFILA